MDKTRKINLNKLKKVISITSYALSILIFVTALYIGIVSTVARSRGEQPSVFGYSFSIVVTDSMQGEIEVGELIIYNRTEIGGIEEGDNIVFVARSGAVAGQSVVHKVNKIGVDEQGIFLETKGVNNDLPDEEYVRADNLLGIVVHHSAFLGLIVSFFSNIVNVIILFVVLIAVFVAIKQIVKIVRLIMEKPTEEDENLQSELNGEKEVESRQGELIDNVEEGELNSEKEVDIVEEGDRLDNSGENDNLGNGDEICENRNAQSNTQSDKNDCDNLDEK